MANKAMDKTGKPVKFIKVRGRIVPIRADKFDAGKTRDPKDDNNLAGVLSKAKASGAKLRFNNTPGGKFAKRQLSIREQHSANVSQRLDKDKAARKGAFSSGVKVAALAGAVGAFAGRKGALLGAGAGFLAGHTARYNVNKHASSDSSSSKTSSRQKYLAHHKSGRNIARFGVAASIVAGGLTGARGAGGFASMVVGGMAINKLGRHRRAIKRAGRLKSDSTSV